MSNDEAEVPLMCGLDAVLGFPQRSYGDKDPRRWQVPTPPAVAVGVKPHLRHRTVASDADPAERAGDTRQQSTAWTRWCWLGA